MYKMLHETLVSIYNCYASVYESGKQIYELLKERELREIQPLHVEQLKTLEQLKELKLSLEKMLRTFCQEHYIQEVKIRSVVTLFTEEERDNIIALLERIQQREESTKKTLLQNQYYLDIMMKTTESMVDFIAEMNMEKMHNSQLFMNELL